MMCDPEFEKAKVIYEESGLHFRALNEIMWRIPTLAMTLTGGLWFGISQVGQGDSLIRLGMYLLACFGNLAFLLALWRLRKGVMEPYLEVMNNYSGQQPSQYDGFWERNLIGKSYFVIILFSLMLVMASLVSGYGVYSTLQDWREESRVEATAKSESKATDESGESKQSAAHKNLEMRSNADRK